MDPQVTWINSKFIDERDIQMVPWVSPYDEGDAVTTALAPNRLSPQARQDLTRQAAASARSGRADG